MLALLKRIFSNHFYVSQSQTHKYFQPERLLRVICLFNVKMHYWWKRFRKIYPDLTGFPLSRPILIVRSLWKIAGREDWKNWKRINRFKKTHTFWKTKRTAAFGFQSRKVCGRKQSKQFVVVVVTKICAQPNKTGYLMMNIRYWMLVGIVSAGGRDVQRRVWYWIL